MSLSINQPCGIGNGAQIVDGELLADRWSTWSAAERRDFVDGVASLGWVPAGALDLESPAYPGFVALPGNPCFQGMTAPDEFGTRPPDALFAGRPVARVGDLLRQLAELVRRAAGVVSDALRRALDAVARILGTGLGALSLALVAALLVAGVVLISADRRR